LLFAWLFESSFVGVDFPAATPALFATSAGFLPPFSDLGGVDFTAIAFPADFDAAGRGSGLFFELALFGVGRFRGALFGGAFVAERRSLTDGRSRAAAEDRLPPLAEEPAEDDRCFAFAIVR
jgi:hypothetical protein